VGTDQRPAATEPATRRSRRARSVDAGHRCSPSVGHDAISAQQLAGPRSGCPVHTSPSFRDQTLDEFIVIFDLILANTDVSASAMGDWSAKLYVSSSLFRAGWAGTFQANTMNSKTWIYQVFRNSAPTLAYSGAYFIPTKLTHVSLSVLQCNTPTPNPQHQGRPR